MLYGRIRQELGDVIRELARQRESLVLEGHLCSDHIHVYMAIPPKYSVAQVVGYIKGKSAIHIALRPPDRGLGFDPWGTFAGKTIHGIVF